MDVLQTFDELEKASQKQLEEKKKNDSSPKFKFDKLKMYFGEDCTIHGITISIPTIGDILEIGEDNFYKALSPFLNNSTSIRVLLYDAFHKDWNKTKDIEVFYILSQIHKADNLVKMENGKVINESDPLKLIFKNTDFSDFQLMSVRQEINGEEVDKLALYSKSQDIILYEEQYLEIAEYLREIMNIHPKVEHAKGKTTKHWILQEDRMKFESKDKEKSSSLLPVVSACVNHPGFKYKLEELKTVNICQFMDSVNRIQKYEQGTAALKGVYSGFVSAKDIPNELINFMGEI